MNDVLATWTDGVEARCSAVSAVLPAVKCTVLPPGAGSGAVLAAVGHGDDGDARVDEEEQSHRDYPIPMHHRTAAGATTSR